MRPQPTFAPPSAKRSLVLRLSMSLALLILTVAGCDRGADEQPALKMVPQAAGIGWMISFAGAPVDPGTLRVQVGKDAEFRTLRRPVMMLPVDTKATEITVYYTQAGSEHGPLVFQFDPASVQLNQGKNILDMLTTSWVTWRHHHGKNFVNFGFLNLQSCAIRTVEYGLDGTLDQMWTLPPCRHAGIAEDGDESSLEVPLDARTIAVRVTYVDGEQTAIQHFPAGRKIEAGARAAKEAEEVAEAEAEGVARVKAVAEAEAARDLEEAAKSSFSERLLHAVPSLAPAPTKDLAHDRNRTVCLLPVDGDAMTDLVGTTEDGQTLVALSGDDGSLLWHRTFKAVETTFCAGGLLVIQHTDLSLTLVQPSSDTVTSTPSLTSEVAHVGKGDHCLSVAVETGATTALSERGDAISSCEVPRRKLKAHAIRPPMGTRFDRQTYWLTPPVSAFDTRARLVASAGRKGDGIDLEVGEHGPKKFRWSIELPYAFEHRADGAGDVRPWLQLAGGPKLLTLLASNDDAVWLATLNPKDGAVVHSRELKGTGLSPVLLFADRHRILLRTHDGYQAYAPETGALLWSIP